MRRGFTLIEVLIVITIILIVSAVALPVVVPAIRHREVGEAARLLQGALAGARDDAIRTNGPSGIRLMLDLSYPVKRLANGQIDPGQPLAAASIISIRPAPPYTDGTITQWQGALPPTVAAIAYPGPGTPASPNPTYGQTSALMVYESLIDAQGLPQSPTNWYWNIRIGDRLQIGKAGTWYTVIGPMVVTPAQGNGELFVNVGPPGTVSPLPDPLGTTGFPEFLLLVNGRDDNGNGIPDEGWDGVDNDGLNGVDDIGEWIEIEKWSG